MNQTPEYSMDVSIPGVGVTESHQPAPPVPTNQYQAPQPGMTDWALQEAAKRELSQGVYPAFYTKAVEDPVQTREKGRPMFMDQEWVRITIRGDRNSVTDRPVKDEDRTQRWPALYTAFSRGQKRADFGTPLEEWPLVTRSAAENFKHHNIYTVEDLAGLDDQGIKNIGIGARDMVKKAQAYLDQAEDSATPGKLIDKINQLEVQIESLRKNNDELGQVAEGAHDMTGELQSLRQEKQASDTTIQNLQVEVSSLEERLATSEMELAQARNELDTEQKMHRGTKGALTKLKNQMAAQKEPA